MERFAKFFFVGGAATLLQFFLLTLFVKSEWMAATLASAISYGLSAIFNYYANYRLTFASNHKHTQTLPKFVVTALIGAVLNTAFFAAFLFLFKNHLLDGTKLVDSAYLIAQLFATLLTLIVNFTLHKFWIYRS